MNAPILEAKNLTKVYGRRKVVADVSINVQGGEVVGLLGPNGAGKTTSFYMCVGLVSPTAGEVLLDGEAVTSLPVYQRARLGIGYLPQEPSVFRKLTVEENILAILETMDFENSAERTERLNTLIENLGLNHVRETVANALSGGERRRVEITRALARNPKFILLDEPFAGIDPIAVKDIQEIVFQLKSQGIGVLITDHNVRETLGICDRAYILIDGRVMEEGAPDTLAASAQAKRYYLGEDFRLQ